MKKLFFLLLFTALFFLHGASPDLTKGVWYLSVPENNGKSATLKLLTSSTRTVLRKSSGQKNS